MISVPEYCVEAYSLKIRFTTFIKYSNRNGTDNSALIRMCPIYQEQNDKVPIDNHSGKTATGGTYKTE